ncbi:MAG: DEAD/DEAH box helicase, partial [Lachnospiraceae bacterium]|nr:DEAD/DEAH box helicase [Lachnospiraceae bacterium]
MLNNYFEDDIFEEFGQDDFMELEELGVVYNDSDISDTPKEKVVTLEDGFDITRNMFGYINLEYWASITGNTVDELIQLANGKLIWRNPDQLMLGADKTVGWVTKQELLIGNRVKKLKEARKINELYGQMDEVIKLLEDNLPEEVCGEDIHVNIGSTWVLSIDNFIADFIAKLLDMAVPPTVIYDPFRGRWDVIVNRSANYILNNFTYGTKHMSAIRIIINKLNARPIKVYASIQNPETGNYDSVINRAHTIAAQEKANAIDVCFQDYCHGDKYNEEKLQKAYADHYGYGISKFDGDYLELKELSNDVKPYKHQKDAIAHILSTHNVLLAHDVGSGKTLEFSCGVHELLRLELCSKALIVVPNNTLDAAAKAYKELYPNDSIMVCRPRKEFAPQERNITLKKIKNAKQVVVFMAYSSYDMITLSKEYAFAKKEEQIRECDYHIANAENASQRNKLRTLKKSLKKSVDKYKESFKNNELACFDELGFDCIVVDESHNYKNITIDYQGSDSIVGMHIKGSKKADNMLEKVRYIQEQDGRVIFATGTPITNSLADLYTLQYYLQPEELKMCNIYHFNDWINTFCQEEYSFEVDVDSKNCRFTTRFSCFHNLPELMTMFSAVCDFYQGDNEELGLPDFEGYTDIVVKKSEAQALYIDDIVRRTEVIRNREISRREDNLLKVTVQGRMAALDIRLVEPEAISEEDKVSICAKNISYLYFEYPDKCQIAFSDIGTPKDRFNVYDELKEKLIEMNVKANEIAFIHDASTEAQRSKLEKQFNDGKIRILIGSTSKLGTGSNVQNRLIAVHHIDVPWKPSDMVQREGRIIRQGNTCDKVYIFRYITESSFDAYTYQILENKQKFIAQFLSGSLSVIHRSEGDCADTVLSYSEIKALAIGNPLIKERVEVANELEHARI